ncbi:MAG: MFS transporter, partial [Acidobacteriota bacterium]|nr:MFS transporter [Acidobacteriota bacterium]
MNASRYPWVVVALLWVVGLLNYLDRQVIFSLFPLLRSDLGLSDTQLGFIGTAFLWVYAAASPFSGFLGDRYGPKRVIVASLLIWSGVTWATGFARTFPELLATRALMGISEACYLPAGLAMIAAYHGDATRSRATGLHFSGIYVGIVIGGIGGGWVGQHYGWRAAFFVLGVVGILYSLVLLPSLKDRQPTFRTNHMAFWSSAKTVVSTPGVPKFLTVFGAKSTADWLVYTWVPLYLYERFHMSLAESGFSATFYAQAASFAGILLGGWLADRWSQSNAAGRALTQAAGLAAAAPFLFAAGVTSSSFVLIASLAVFGLGRGMFDANAMPVLCQLVPPELRGTGYGLLN